MTPAGGSRVIELCEVCDRRPVARVLDFGGVLVRVCASCASELRRDPEALVALVESVYRPDEEAAGV